MRFFQVLLHLLLQAGPPPTQASEGGGRQMQLSRVPAHPSLTLPHLCSLPQGHRDSGSPKTVMNPLTMNKCSFLSTLRLPSLQSSFTLGGTEGRAITVPQITPPVLTSCYHIHPRLSLFSSNLLLLSNKGHNAASKHI